MRVLVRLAILVIAVALLVPATSILAQEATAEPTSNCQVGWNLGTVTFSGCTPTEIREIVAELSANDFPRLHHADSHPPEAGPGSFDIGVNEGQIGIVFGVHVEWPQGNLDAGGNDCDIVVLNPGFYPDLRITDARYEIYDLPDRDQDGWITVLAEQRAEEQGEHYLCSGDVEDVLVWSADPHEEPWATRRRASGEDYLIPFNAGDEVFGFSIYLGDVVYTEGVGHDGNLICDGGGCYLPEAPTHGWVGGGVVNSWWPGEIPADAVPISVE